MKKILIGFLPVLFALSCEEPYVTGRIVPFEPESPGFLIKVSPVEQVTVEVNPVKEKYAKGEYVQIKAIPQEGYSFLKWSGTIDSEQNPFIIIVEKDEWIIPNFEQIRTYSLITDWDPLGGAIVSSANDKITFLSGEKISLRAFPKTGYEFIGWEGDIVSVSAALYITFDKDYQVYAKFNKIPEAVTYTLTINPSSTPNGTIQIIPDKSSYYANEIVRITAVPGSGYMFRSWAAPYESNASVFDITMDDNKNISANFDKRKWTFIVYMAADNNLEPAAIADFNELESANFANQPVSALVLFDRGPGYDSTNGNWTDTRLFEIKKDPAGNDSTIISTRLGCLELGLSAGSTTELNMADPLVLSRLIEFSKRVYTADNYGLIIWGHGTGWKSTGAYSENTLDPRKAVAIDDTNGNYMHLKSFGNAVSGKGLNLVGFDTCFGALLEVTYQIRSSADYLIASEGLISSSGWDYGVLFDNFFSRASLQPIDFCDAAVYQYSNQYSTAAGATISTINLEKIDSLFSTFENFSHTLADNVSSENRSQVLNAVLNGPDIDRYFESPPSDLYVDIYSFSQAVTNIVPNANLSALQAAIDNAVISSWSQKYGAVRKNIGIYVVSLQAAGVPKTNHDPGYINGSSNTNKSAFVEQSNYWVPHVIPQESSFLDKLFYITE